MAKIAMNIPIGTSLGDYSIYKMEGVEGLILRSKGGPTAEQMLNGEQFVRVRENMSEFAGCGKIAGRILNACYGVKPLGDYMFCGQFSKIAKIIQKRDVSHVRGERSILISAHGKMFEGFNFNKVHPFDNVVKQSPSYFISRIGCKATLVFPELVPNINLVNPWSFSQYRFVVVLGIVPDLIISADGYVPVTRVDTSTSVTHTEWSDPGQVRTGFEMEIKIVGEPLLDSSLSLFLSVGIEFGQATSTGIINTVKKAGCAKILAHG
jgi:hypothetical protein